MSITISNSQQICHASTNHSRSKMLFSFKKSNRFLTNKENQCHDFYNVSGSKRKRSTCFGYGNKYDFTKELPDTPPPGAYEKLTTFQESKKKKKGFGFGSGRGEMQVTGQNPKNSNPGPGSYEYPSYKDKISYSLKAKLKISNKEKLGIPGPGRYESYSTFNKKNFLSKHINRQGRLFENNDKLRVQDYKIPGPGAYNTSNTDFSPEGKYYLARFETAKSRKFGRSLRKTFQKRCKTPGPGNYRIPSQFGYYVAKNHQNDSFN